LSDQNFEDVIVNMMLVVINRNKAHEEAPSKKDFFKGKGPQDW
jgi:hypothetical protein